MAASITPAQAQAMFKQIYGDEFIKACEVEKELQETFPFKENDKPGEAYVEAIRMTEEQGFSFRKGGQAATLLNPPIALKTERATILGDVLEFRSRVDIETMARAMNSKQAFKQHVGLRMEAMRDSLVKHLEWSCLQGGRPVGVVASMGAGTTTRTITFTAASWVPGFWAGSENMPFDCYDSTSATLAPAPTKRNTSSGTATFTVTSYDLDAKTVTFTAPNASDFTNIVANDCFWRYGSYLNEPAGLVRITANTSGAINNIDPATYALWKGVTDSSGGTISMARILAMSAKIAARSSTKKVFTVRLSPLNFSVVNSDLAAARRYDGSYSKVKGTNGYGAIEFYAPNGVLRLQTHNYMKDGEVHINCDARTSRRGVSDIDFSMPGAAGGEYFLIVPDYGQVEYRAYSQQGIFHQAPSQSGLFTGLTVP